MEDTKLTDKQYREHPALSYSDLVWLDKSPLHFKNRDKLRKETEAMRLGTLLHLGVLEPERFKNAYCIEPEEIDGQPINRRVKAHRDYLEQWRNQNKGKIFIRPEDMDTLTTMFNALATHKYAKQYLTGGVSEVMAFGEYKGVPIKGRCDYLVEIPGLGKTIVDLKKTQDASPKGFERSIYNYKYYLQAAVYTKLFKADSFVFVAIEDNELAPIGIYRASDVLLEKGEQKLSYLIDLYKRLDKTNNWHGYTEDFQEISLPTWAVSTEE
jgi:exodeoxyribonuclease VIII